MAVSIGDLRQRTSMRHAYLLLIEGVPFAFTDEPELAVPKWWLEDGPGDDRVIKLGLTVPETLKFSLELESGLLEEDQAVFRLLDIDGTVPEFFGGLAKVDLVKGLGARLLPTQDPAPATIDNYGEALDLDSSYVGTEAIGPAGQRNFYSATPGWGQLPGQDHPTRDEPLPVVSPAGVGPYLIEGRRVALYRVIYDPDAGEWPGFSTHVAQALTVPGWSPMLWWGTLRQAGKVEGRIWSITCTGPGSWLRRSLHNRSTTGWYQVTADFELDDNEKHIGITFNKRYFEDGSYFIFANTYSAYLVDPTSKDTIISSIAAAITATKSAVGDDGVWTTSAGIGAGEIDFTEDYIQISISPSAGYQANMFLTLSRKVWRAIGYDPDAGIDNDGGPGPRFNVGSSFDFISANPDIIVDPPPSYYTAHITTCPEGTSPVGFTGEASWSGSDNPRAYFPTYVSGVSVLNGAGGQVVRFIPEDNADVYVEGQTIRAHESAVEINGSPCTAQRLWCFRGKIQLPQQFFTDKEGAAIALGPEPEPVDTVQVARCLWVESESGVVAPDGTGTGRGLYIAEWLDPRLFGLNYEPIDQALGWASNDGGESIECSPMAHLGAFYRRPDRVDHTLLRTLVSTGTAVWTPGTEDVADGSASSNASTDLTPGDNDLTPQWPAGDFEIYDLGLQIPKAMVDTPMILDAAADLPGGSTGPLGQSKVAVQGGPLQSEELLQALMAPRGWALSLKRGRIGLWAPHASPEAKFDDARDFVIGEADLHGTAGDPASTIPSIELRPVFPFDRLAWTHTGNPTETWTEGQEELKYKARDTGARARSGTRVRDLAAPDLIATNWFVSGDQQNPNNADTDLIKGWTSEVVQLWEREIAAWLAQPHRLVQGLRISRPKGQDIYPGAILRLTNPWPANSMGTYGVTGAYARVLSVAHETDSCAAVVDALLYATPPGALRWAPILRVVDDAATTADRYDAASQTFTVQDWGNVAAPLEYFVKPDYVDVADASAAVWILQFDGAVWVRTATGFVSSVSTGAGTLTLTGAGLTGTFYERMYALIVLAPADDPDQVDWVRALYVQHVLGSAPGSAPKLPK